MDGQSVYWKQAAMDSSPEGPAEQVLCLGSPRRDQHSYHTHLLFDATENHYTIDQEKQKCKSLKSCGINSTDIAVILLKTI